MQLFPKETISTSPASCASELLEVVPAIMRTIRGQMRSSTSSELSVPQFRTLGFLSRRPGSSLSDLAEHIGISLPSASKLVGVLMKRGYLQSQIDIKDRRRTILAPTAKGSRVLGIARAATRDFLAGLISELDHNQRRDITQAMETLRTIFTPEFTDRRNGKYLDNKRPVATVTKRRGNGIKERSHD